MANIRTSDGSEVDVEAIAEASPEDAFLLLSEAGQNAVERLDPSVRQEVGELIVALADVIARSGDTDPTARIDVRGYSDGSHKVRVEREGETICHEKTGTIVSGAVTGVAGLWINMINKEEDPREQYVLSVEFLQPLTGLVKRIVNTIATLNILVPKSVK